ncbi:hypothetical protein N7453_007853 [Penicillium expansum]|nr:hypothetical protein N7453_007853 [Penicillium expansum]
MGEWVAPRIKMVTPNPSLLRLNISHIASFRISIRYASGLALSENLTALDRQDWHRHTSIWEGVYELYAMTRVARVSPVPYYESSIIGYYGAPFKMIFIVGPPRDP